MSQGARSSSLKRHLATHLNSTLLPPGTTTNQHHNNPQQQSSSTVTPQQMPEEEPKFTTHLALPSNVQLPATVTVTMPVQVHPAPQQQQQPQQQTLVSHHLSQLVFVVEVVVAVVVQDVLVLESSFQ